MNKWSIPSLCCKKTATSCNICFNGLILVQGFQNAYGCPPNLPWNKSVFWFKLEKIFSLCANPFPGLQQKYVRETESCETSIVQITVAGKTPHCIFLIGHLSCQWRAEVQEFAQGGLVQEPRAFTQVWSTRASAGPVQFSLSHLWILCSVHNNSQKSQSPALSVAFIPTNVFSDFQI